MMPAHHPAGPVATSATAAHGVRLRGKHRGRISAPAPGHAISKRRPMCKTATHPAASRPIRDTPGRMAPAVHAKARAVLQPRHTAARSGRRRRGLVRNPAPASPAAPGASAMRSRCRQMKPRAKMGARKRDKAKAPCAASGKGDGRTIMTLARIDRTLGCFAWPAVSPRTPRPCHPPGCAHGCCRRAIGRSSG